MSADCCRTVAIDLAFQRYLRLGAPSLSPKHLSLCQVAPSIELSFVIWFPVIINEGQEGWSAVALKPMMGSHASDLSISKIADQSKIQGIQQCLLGGTLARKCLFHCRSHRLQ